jgi:multidrug resistance protein, MATE family
MLDLKYKTILKVALPLMVSSFIQAIVLITDTAFLSRHDTLSYDAAGNAGLLFMTLFIAMTGMSDGTQILIARRIGQNKLKRVGRIFGTTLITLGGLALTFWVIIQFLVPSFLTNISKSMEIANLQIEFLNYRSYALFLGIFLLSSQAFFFATGKTKVVLFSSIIIAFSNIALDWVLIFGKFGLPSMGITGAALASTIAEGIGALFLLSYLLFGKQKKKYHLFSSIAFRMDSFKELIKIGSPIMLQGIFALGTWTIFFIWIEQMGEFELTVSQNIRSIYFLAFIPIWGFSTTTKTYISQYIGNKKFDELKKVQKRIQMLTALFLGFIIAVTISFPYQIISLVNPEEAYLEKTKEILYFISSSTMIFGLFSVYFQTINGSGNTFATLIIEAICVGVYILSAYILIKVLKMDILWVWAVEYIYFIAMGTLSFGYLKLFNWKQKEI